MDDLGPIDFVAVAFPQGRVGTEGFDRLLDLADRGVISILDVEFVAKDADGDVASSVHGRVQRRQQQRWAAQERHAPPATCARSSISPLSAASSRRPAS